MMMMLFRDDLKEKMTQKQMTSEKVLIKSNCNVINKTIAKSELKDIGCT